MKRFAASTVASMFASICAGPAMGQARLIDTEKSVMTVHVSKAGVFSAFGHDHEIAAPIAGGGVDVGGRKVELHVNAPALRVEDQKASDKDRNEIQTTMLGPEVLDTAKYKEIRFRSSRAEAAAGVWQVAGDLTLHGETHPVSMEVREKDGHYTGECRFKISSFGMKPVKVAGGAVRVKDEVELHFDIQLAH